MTDLGNQQDVQKRNKTLKVPAARLKDAVRWIMSDERGRFYLGHLVDESGALKRGVSGITEGVLYEQGVREMGLKVMEDVRALDEPGQPAKNLIQLLSGAIKNPKKDEDDGNRADTDT